MKSKYDIRQEQLKRSILEKEKSLKLNRYMLKNKLLRLTERDVRIALNEK